MPSRLPRTVAVVALAAAAVAAAGALAPLGRHERRSRLGHAAILGPRSRGRTRAAGPRWRGRMVTGPAARRRHVPILMYHVIADPPPGAPYPDLWVSPRAFAAQVRALAAAGYRGVTLSRALAAWRRGRPLPAMPVVLSFDDGYRSQAAVAGPVLRAAGWPGVLDLAIRNSGRGGISVARLRGLARDGWEIASHTVDHLDLTMLGAAAMRAQLVRSRAWIRRRLGVAPAFFCYPAGRFDARVQAAVRAAGYRGATTEVSGVARAADDPYRLPRIRVSRGETATELLASIRDG